MPDAFPENVLIVGGGVIGMMTAMELVEAGCRVTLLERGELGREASWAGGGIVSPLYPWRYSPPVTALTRLAQAAYPQLAAKLLAVTGIDAEFQTCGMLMLDADDSRDALSWAAAAGQQMEAVAPADLYSRFSFLAAGFQRGLWMPAMANIRNPRLLKALKAWLSANSLVMVRENTPVRELICDDGHCHGVRLETGEQLRADAVAVCGGAWSGNLLGGIGQVLPVRPIQGQMIIYKAEPGALPCMVMAAGRYLIPRRDGHVLCGSTLEDVGFDKHTTAEGLASLKASAETLWPALRLMQPVAHWAGLRPASPNGIPFIGPVPGVDNLWVNAGQFRNGLVLAPASAHLLADLMLGREPALVPGPYRMLV